MSAPAAAGAPENGVFARPGTPQPASRTAAAAAWPPRDWRANRVDVDGRLEEAIWSRALPVGDFIQIDPKTASPPPSGPKSASRRRRRALPGRDGVRLRADRIIGKQRGAPSPLCSDDKILDLDTFLDARTGFSSK